MTPAGNIAWTTEALKARVPRPRPATPDANLPLDKLWAQLLKDFKKLQPRLRLQQPYNITFVGDELAATRYQEGADALQSLLRGAMPKELNVEHEAIVATLFGVSDAWTAPVRAAVMDTLLRYWTAHSGPSFALDAAVETLRWHREDNGGRSANFSVRYALAYTPTGHLQGRADTSATLPGAWSFVRRWLATLDDDAFAEARAHAQSLRSDASAFRRAALAYAFAEPAWARELLEEAVHDGTWPAHMPLLLLALEPHDAPRVLEALHNTRLRYGLLLISELPTLLDTFQHATPALLDALWTSNTLQTSRQIPHNARQSTLESAVAETIALLDSPEAAAWLAARGASPASLQASEAFAARAPHLLLPHLLEHAQATGKDGLLPALLTRHAADLDAWAEAWTPRQRDLLHAREPAGQGATTPLTDALPDWLLHTPKAWKPQPATFWSPSLLPHVQLHTGGALTGDSLEPLRLLLGNLGTPQADDALKELRALATPESLDAFGQALITAWIEAGGAPRERWAFEAGSALVDPAPPTLHEVNQAWFQGKAWYIYKRLKTFTSKELAPLLQARGARTLSSVSNKLDVLVTEGPTPAQGEAFGVAARDAVAVGAKVIGEHDLLRLLRGRLPAAPPEPETIAPSDGLEALRELLYQDTSLSTRWHHITDAIDKLQADAQQAAIDYVDAWLDTLPLQEQRHASLNPWMHTALNGEDHPKLQLVRSATFGTNLNGKAALRLFACTHLCKLQTLNITKSPLSRAAWEALAQAPHLRSLQTLRIKEVKLDQRSAAALAGPASLANVSALDLAGADLGPGAAQALLASGAWTDLTDLDASGVKAAGDTLHRTLTEAAHLRLHTLHLSPPPPEEPAQRWIDLLAAPHLQHLTHLELRGQVSAGAYAALAQAPLLEHLHTLQLHTYTHDPDTTEPELIALLASPCLHSLHTLEVQLRDASPCAAVFLNPALANLTHLHLKGIFVNADEPNTLLQANLPRLRHLTLTTTLPEHTLPNLLLSDRLPALESLHVAQHLSEAELKRLFDLQRPAFKRLTGTHAIFTGGLLLNKLLDHLQITIQ